MDATQLDGWIRSLTKQAPRRTVLGLLGGSLVSLLARLGEEPAAAKHRKPRCKNGKTKCGKKCCAKGQTCIGGACVVQEGTCAAAADSCSVTSTVPCNHNPECSCFQRQQGGVRCVQASVLTACNQCMTDRDCRKLGFPSGSSCIRVDGPTCHCPVGEARQCVEPCGFVPPD